ncbi:SRPBCC family protein [Spirosoma fluminis]
MKDRFSTAVTIQAEPADVWTALTNPDSMVQWLGEPEMNIEVHTNWEIGAPILIRGFHHGPFENKGIVLHYDKEKTVSYSHLSSASDLPDRPENYSIFEFNLTPTGKDTLLALTIENFPTETIRNHLEFYWRTTVVLLKERIEKQLA